MARTSAGFATILRTCAEDACSLTARKCQELQCLWLDLPHQLSQKQLFVTLEGSPSSVLAQWDSFTISRSTAIGWIL